MTKNKNIKKRSNAQLKFPPLHPSVHVFAALVLFGIAVLLSRGEGMPSWETSLFLAIYEWPAFLLPFFFVFTQLGSIHALGLLLVFLLVKQKHNMTLRVLLTAMLAYLLS